MSIGDVFVKWVLEKVDKNLLNNEILSLHSRIQRVHQSLTILDGLTGFLGNIITDNVSSMEVDYPTNGYQPDEIDIREQELLKKLDYRLSEIQEVKVHIGSGKKVFRKKLKLLKKDVLQLDFSFQKNNYKDLSSEIVQITDRVERVYGFANKYLEGIYEARRNRDASSASINTSFLSGQAMECESICNQLRDTMDKILEFSNAIEDQKTKG